MLPAIGAASLALDAIQSLTSPQPASPSSAAGMFGPTLADAGDTSSSSSSQPAASGFSSAQISADNLNALIDAQSLSSANLTGTPDSGSSGTDPSQGQSASSAYNATQSAAIPLGLSAFSVSV